MKRNDMEKILNIGVRLSSERNLDELLVYILKSVMELAGCDAGTLYLREGDALNFEVMRNDTLGTYSAGQGKCLRHGPAGRQDHLHRGREEQQGL